MKSNLTVMARGSAASRAMAMTARTASRLFDAAHRIRASSFLIDGEAVIARDDGLPDFHALRSRRRGHEAVLLAFDLIEHDGDDLRYLPLIERKHGPLRAPDSGFKSCHRVRLHLDAWSSGSHPKRWAMNRGQRRHQAWRFLRLHVENSSLRVPRDEYPMTAAR
jgi:hypothetical protein